jgi:hypothetical protein
MAGTESEQLPVADSCGHVNEHLCSMNSAKTFTSGARMSLLGGSLAIK